MLNFVKNGVVRLPPGFRFHPTDEELVVQYLKRKVFSFPLPASVIPDFDLCNADPWDLPGDSAKERYFFSTREAKYPNGNRCNRATASGYWKATGMDKQIMTSKSNQVVGMKKTLVFYRRKPRNGSRTDWIMHEYRLLSTHTNASPKEIPSQTAALPMDSWVVCRVFLKKRKGKNDEDNGDGVRRLKTNQPVLYEFMKKGRIGDLSLVPFSSSSGSSGITEVSACDAEEHEESSSCNSFLASQENLRI